MKLFALAIHFRTSDGEEYNFEPKVFSTLALAWDYVHQDIKDYAQMIGIDDPWDREPTPGNDIIADGSWVWNKGELHAELVDNTDYERFCEWSITEVEVDPTFAPEGVER